MIRMKRGEDTQAEKKSEEVMDMCIYFVVTVNLGQVWEGTAEGHV